MQPSLSNDVPFVNQNSSETRWEFYLTDADAVSHDSHADYQIQYRCRDAAAILSSRTVVSVASELSLWLCTEAEAVTDWTNKNSFFCLCCDETYDLVFGGGASRRRIRTCMSAFPFSLFSSAHAATASERIRDERWRKYIVIPHHIILLYHDVTSQNLSNVHQKIDINLWLLTRCVLTLSRFFTAQFKIHKEKKRQKLCE
jgi:hypothetical protein